MYVTKQSMSQKKLHHIMLYYDDEDFLELKSLKGQKPWRIFFSELVDLYKRQLNEREKPIENVVEEKRFNG